MMRHMQPLLFSCSKNSLSLSGRPRLLCSLFHELVGELRGKTTWHRVNELCSDEERGIFHYIVSLATLPSTWICWMLGRRTNRSALASGALQLPGKDRVSDFPWPHTTRKGGKDGSFRELIWSQIWAIRDCPCKSVRRVHFAGELP